MSDEVERLSHDLVAIHIHELCPEYRHVEWVARDALRILIVADSDAPPLALEEIGCRFCWADPRYTVAAADPTRACPDCGADYTGPRRPSLVWRATKPRLANRAIASDPG